MNTRQRIRDERGVALIVVLFVALVVGAISAGAALIGSNTSLINRYTDRQSVLVAVADAALEEARSMINGDGSLYPDSGYTVLESGADVFDGDGQLIPAVQRWMYVGPSGVTSGQYGVFGSIVTVVEDNTGNRIIRRGEVAQESFAKFAYFTDVEPSNISFGGGDMIQGPVHTNDDLKIYASGATFLGTVTTAKTVPNPENGTFEQGYTEYAPRIEMPTTAELDKLQVQAAAGLTAFVGDAVGDDGQATTRIEFIAIDLDNDGQVNGTNEGFMRVYQSNDEAEVVADVPGAGMQASVNCGAYYDDPPVFVAAADHPYNGVDWLTALQGAGARCYLGGADSLFGSFQASGGSGDYLPWTGTVDPLVSAARPDDAAYLIPITRELNPSFKGVIHVEGKVAVSGVLRGRVTVAATEDIVIADDITYATNPGAGTCNDILGLFAGDDIVVSDNSINAPADPAGGTDYRTFDDTKDEFIHAVMLALNNFTVENWGSGSTDAEACEATDWGRGCLYLTGGIIQSTRGAVGTSAGTGYVKRYSYDQCAFSNPPPYFPTTGHFARARYYEVDPVNFDVDRYWAMLTVPLN